MVMEREQFKVLVKAMKAVYAQPMEMGRTQRRYY